MEIADLLPLSGVLDDVKAGSKKQALQELSAVAAAQTAQEERTVLDLVLARERLGSTGVGAGVAIPHGRLGSLTRGSRRCLPACGSPSSSTRWTGSRWTSSSCCSRQTLAGSDHLKALALVSRLLRDHRVCARLRGADNAEALYAVLTRCGRHVEGVSARPIDSRRAEPHGRAMVLIHASCVAPGRQGRASAGRPRRRQVRPRSAPDRRRGLGSSRTIRSH